MQKVYWIHRKKKSDKKENNYEKLCPYYEITKQFTALTKNKFKWKKVNVKDHWNLNESQRMSIYPYFEWLNYIGRSECKHKDSPSDDIKLMYKVFSLSIFEV